MQSLLYIWWWIRIGYVVYNINSSVIFAVKKESVFVQIFFATQNLPRKIKTFGLGKEICWDFDFPLKWDIWSMWLNYKVVVTLKLTRIREEDTPSHISALNGEGRTVPLTMPFVALSCEGLGSHNIPGQNFLVSHNIPIIWLRNKVLRKKIWNPIHSDRIPLCPDAGYCCP